VRWYDEIIVCVSATVRTCISRRRRRVVDDTGEQMETPVLRRRIERYEVFVFFRRAFGIRARENERRETKNENSDCASTRVRATPVCRGPVWSSSRVRLSSPSSRIVVVEAERPLPSTAFSECGVMACVRTHTTHERRERVLRSTIAIARTQSRCGHRRRRRRLVFKNQRRRASIADTRVRLDSTREFAPSRDVCMIIVYSRDLVGVVDPSRGLDLDDSRRVSSSFDARAREEPRRAAFIRSSASQS